MEEQEKNKNMTQEEKARAYDEALERAQKATRAGSDVAMDIVQYIFPQLTENEDEKIINTLIWLVEGRKKSRTTAYGDVKIDDILAWLEKQKENIEKEYVFRPLAGTDITIAAKQAIRKADEGDHLVLAFNGAYIPVRKGVDANKIVDIYDNIIEKQKERGPLTKEEEYILHRIIEYLEDETCPSEWISLLHDIYCLPYEKQKEQKSIKMEVYEVGKGTTICGQDYKCKKDYKEGNCWYIKDVIYHCSRDGFLNDQNGVSWSCTPEWFKEYIYSNTEWAEEEKTRFVSGQFLQCKLSFDEFKEGEHYWLEYIGDDMYVGRSDNILNQKFHITPRQLYTLFSQQLEEKQKEQKHTLKFKVGDKVHMEGDDSVILTITEIKEDRYLTDCAYGPILFGAEDIWQIVEQKPEWNANDKAFVKDCARILDENGYTASAERLLSMFPVKPAEWSEEDESFLDSIEEAIHSYYDLNHAPQYDYWIEKKLNRPVL